MTCREYDAPLHNPAHAVLQRRCPRLGIVCDSLSVASWPKVATVGSVSAPTCQPSITTRSLVIWSRNSRSCRFQHSFRHVILGADPRYERLPKEGSRGLTAGQAHKRLRGQLGERASRHQFVRIAGMKEPAGTWGTLLGAAKVLLVGLKVGQ